MIAAALILLGVFGSTALVAGQDQCQCLGAVLIAPTNTQQWFYTFPQHYPDTCVDDATCSRNCYFLVKGFSKYFNYNANVEGNTSLGNWICQKVGRDLPKGSSVRFLGQACNRQAKQVAILQNDFCCVGGKYPSGGCK